MRLMQSVLSDENRAGDVGQGRQPAKPGARLARFILLSSVGGLRLTGPSLRQTAIGQKRGQAEREQVPRGFGAIDIPRPCRPQVQLMSLSRSRKERRSCLGCAGRMQFGRRKEPVPIGRDNVRYCG